MTLAQLDAMSDDEFDALPELTDEECDALDVALESQCESKSDEWRDAMASQWVSYGGYN